MATAKLWWNGSSWVGTNTNCFTKKGGTSSSNANTNVTVNVAAYDDFTVKLVLTCKATYDASPSIGAICWGTISAKSGSTTIVTQTWAESQAAQTRSVTANNVQGYAKPISCTFNVDAKSTDGYGGSQNTSYSLNYSSPFATITYYDNGGSGGPGTQNVFVGNNTLSNTRPTRTGYTFLGWSTSSTATSASYQPNESYNITSDLILYAVWEVITYTITYDANGGSGAPASQTKDYGVTVTLSETIPSWTGRNFKGWAESSTGSVEYQPGATYDGNADLDLYAIWELQTWKITYDANGGSGAPASQTKIYGTDLTLSGVRPSKASQSADSYIVTLNGNNGSVSPSQLTAARISNYSFNIWNTKSNGSGTNYSPSQNYSTNASLDLYAQWNTNTTTASVALPTNPSRTGYTFLGWNENASASTGITGYYTPTGNVILYAIWKTQSKIYIDNNLVTNAYLGVVPIKKIYLNQTVLFEQD